MRILDRYLFGSMLRVFIGCVLAFLMLYIVIDVFSHLDEILEQKPGLLLLAMYYLNFLPLIFVQISPFACLLGCLYTLGTLNRNNEIIAMRASGLSIFYINRTLIIFAALISVAVFAVNDKLAPQSEIAKESVRVEMENKHKTEKQQAISNLSIYGLKNRLFFINKFIPAENRMEGITILEQDEAANVRKKIVASYGVYKEGFWRFSECVTYFFDENDRLSGQPQYLSEQIMDIVETPQDFLKQMQKPEFMSVDQLNEYILKLPMSRVKGVIRNLKVDLYQRFFMPLGNLVIVIAGIPFALIMRRRATSLFSIGIAIMMGLLYYVVNAVSIAFGKAGLLPPLLAASSSHILFLSLGLYLIHQHT